MSYNQPDKKIIKIFLYISSIQAAFFGIALIFRDFYYNWSWINLKMPEPPLYANVASAFLLIIALWTFYVGYTMNQDLWIIPAGSALGRIFYFLISFLGFIYGSNEFLYTLIGLTDLIIGIGLIIVTFKFRNNQSI
ncbi:MAG: hypothetical protein ACFFD1_00300 [Candidatus Thorarchaeota archaeon]